MLGVLLHHPTQMLSFGINENAVMVCSGPFKALEYKILHCAVGCRYGIWI